MNNNSVIGINEQQIRAITNKLTSNIEKLESKFNQIDAIIHDISPYYKADSNILFRKKYDNLRLNYDIVRKNLLSYVDDLNSLIISYKKMEANAVDMANKFEPIDIN